MKAIGTNKIVYENDGDATTFGTGNVVVDNDNNVVTYSLSANYRLMNDIPLNINDLWQLPEDFTGKFVSESISENHPVYDKTSDTIYIYHSYQLETIDSANASQEPVMTKDANPETYGMGQFIYIDTDSNYITYNSNHKYILSKSFTANRPKLLSAQYIPTADSNDAINAQKAGRNHIGQVYATINDEKYILIGNKQQLAAIGTGKQVAPMLFVRTDVKILAGLIHKTTLIPYYPGDADLNITNIDDTDISYKDIETDTKNFQYIKEHEGDSLELWNPDFDDPGLIEGVVDILNKLLNTILTIVGSSSSEIVGLKDENTNNPSIGEDKNDGLLESGVPEYENFDNIKKQYKDLKYTSDANYIVFRDIDLSNEDWNPIMFSGTMIGAKSNETGGLWANNEIVQSEQAVISNVKINQNKAINIKEQSGVGFFGTISSKSSLTTNDEAEQVTVKNIKLKNVNVENNTKEIEKDKEGLLALILDLVGGLTEALLGNLGSILDALLNPSTDPTVFATGGFAGRINGNVVVEDCTIENLTGLKNINGMTGGFVGDVEGETKYGNLQEALGSVVDILEALLNIIPLVDLGTLIEVLLDGEIIELDKLIPTGYYSPTINNCDIINSDNLTINPKPELNDENNPANTDFVGGFAGKVVGTQIANSEVQIPNLTVNGKNMVGGFSGFTANGELVGLLDNLGVDLINSIRLNSFILNCKVKTDELVLDANNDYCGGLTGALANSFSINNEISNFSEGTVGTISINATNYAGGISGVATLGQAISLGEFYNGKKDLVSLISKVVNGALSGDAGNVLLSLTGVSPSVIAGNKVLGKLNVSVDNNYAGGIIGQGDGVKIIATSNLDEKSFIWSKVKDKLKYQVSEVSEQKNTIEKLESVSAKNYVGGAIGDVRMASAAGLLNNILGIANYLKFDVEEVNIGNSSDSAQIIATKNYAGGFAGNAIGGDITNSNVNNLELVQADNYAGGFIGNGGTGSLADIKGLNILGLVEISNLLSVADGVVLNINNSNINGSLSGMVVKSLGERENNETDKDVYYAGGFIGKSTSAHINNSHVDNIKQVNASNEAGYAGGFAGVSETGNLASVTKDSEGLLQGVLDLGNLLNLVPYLVSEFKNTTVSYVSNDGQPQVQANYAGGYVGQMQSGKVDNSDINTATVNDLEYVKGKRYSGGFAGRIYSGGLASADGLSVLGGALNINLTNLISLLNVYVPFVIGADVLSDELVVEATVENESGYAGGYVGYGSGLKISDSSVSKLMSKNSSESTKEYAVSASHYAGGYVGRLDIGSAASLGEGLKLLGGALEFSNVLQALDVVASQIENSDVTGAVGGFSVIAEGTADENDYIGNAGGFAGAIYGSQVQNSNCYNFESIIGQETAGGYAGRIEPGSVANVLGDNDAANNNILNGLINADNLLTVLQTFIPMIYNSKTTSVPCGGIVEANKASDDTRARGMAGGYIGYNLGGRVEGNSTREWRNIDGEKIIPEYQQTNSVYRLRKVSGYEFAGGFTGKLENASAVDTGNLEILYGFIKLDNPIQALGAVYPTETNTAVYGPLRGLEVDEWNAWVEAVGSKGSYGNWIKTVESQDDLTDLINKYAYGYEVIATRNNTATDAKQGGVAGGYVGRMDGGIITNANANDLKSANAYRSSGGFAGEMITAGVANVGGIEIADIEVLGDLGGLLNVFVPVINKSSITGYKSGMVIETSGTNRTEYEGNAGGFVGSMIGGQINPEANDASSTCKVENLKQVKGSNSIGGFAGSILPGSAAKVNTASNQGILNKLLEKLIGSVSDLVQVLNATLATVKYASVNSSNAAGFVVDGKYGTSDYAYAAGGFAGNVNGAVLGNINDSVEAVTLSVNNLQSVIGGEHVGGFLGLGDVASVAQVGETTETTILDLIKLGDIDLLDAFRTYVYNGKVTGAKNGLNISAHTENKIGDSTSTVYTGNAGGFAGSLLNGSIKNSRVENINSIKALNYAGGFIGHMGKSGTIDIDSIGTEVGLLNGTAGVLDVFGSHADNCYAEGMTNNGFTVKSSNGTDSLAGGFVGNGDLAKIDNCHVRELKQVASDLTAGGFVGKTSFAYLDKIEASSDSLLNPILTVVNKLLDYLYIDNLENIGLIEIDVLGKLLKLEVLSDGDVLSVTLLGLPITVSLVRASDDSTSDVAKITIGDSYIEIPCYENNGEDGNHINPDDATNISIGLIKANRTKITNSSVDGIEAGYDIFGAGASNNADGSRDGYAGGFVGFNDEGLLEENEMLRADTIRGAADKIGGFSGNTSLKSVYDFNTIYGIEGNGNKYHVYRIFDDDELNYLYKFEDEVTTKDDNKILENQKVLLAEYKPIDGNTPNYYDYEIEHLNAFIENENRRIPVRYLDKSSDWEGAFQTTADKFIEFDAKVYVSDCQLNLMTGAVSDENIFDPIKEEGAMQDPCTGDNINLTIQKLWIDNNNEDSRRPSTLTITLKRYITDDNQKIYDDTFNGEVTITSDNADYDTNSWSITNPYPLFDEDGNRYTYEVIENVIDGYLTIYDQSKDGYTFYITNYRTTAIMNGDSVVIDYGLPVTVDVMSNDRSELDNAELLLSGITKINRDGETGGVSGINPDTVSSSQEYNNLGITASCVGNYGNAEVLDDTSIKYSPTNMNMDNFEKLLYALKVTGDTKNAQDYVYSTLDVIPATEIYYEDDFKTVEYHNGTFKEGEVPEGNKWQEDGIKDDDREQDSTRPGVETITKVLDDQTKKEYDNLYGFDTSYLEDSTYSRGSSHYISVNSNFKNDDFPSISFEFTGTGFDVISLTSNKTGTIITRLYEPDGKGGYKELPSRSWIVDTYYGYVYDDILHQWVPAGDSEESKPLYQVPIIRSGDNSKGLLEYGKYKVTITLTYSESIDQTPDKGGYGFYFDGVRIYGSANKTNNDYNVIDDAYNLDKENNPEYLEIRKMLLSRQDNDNLDLPQPGVGFIDGKDEGATLNDYEDYGPKNETYLKKGQAISFYLESKYLPDSVQFGAKIAQGNNIDLKISCANKENDEWKYYKGKTLTINSATELYRDLSDQCIWDEYEVDGEIKYRTRYPIVITNTSNTENIISLTNVKLTGGPDTDDTVAVNFFAYTDFNAVEAAYSLARSQFEKKITVKYVDQNGQMLADDVITKVDVNNEYDVTDLVNKEIAGYTRLEVKGDTTGIADSDKEITVVYGKNYQLAVKYVDLQGNEIEETYVNSGVEGNEYDVTDLVNKEITGYTRLEVKGDTTGVIDSDKEITVVYGKNYQLTVKYVDENGNELTDTYSSIGVESSSYDLSEYVSKTINGYVFKTLSGDAIKGIVDQDKLIMVIYTQEANENIISNNNQNSNNQTVNDKVVNSTKTGDNLNLLLPIIGLCLSIFVYFVAKQSKKTENE